ncbi:electron transport complex subunit RsxC [Magnetofaba australis]|uniref:Ion-translocating oxidoreductase complex subunit C n=1 Tax=Magnetofaba australis IT-1 TaxID=1434232 RepID=A0A1Y2K2Q9_9PROT|nr:electron transport complex subunit RsxC [Magnetofaba australis]OSM01876.1 putative RnfABCDGE type electron transport complex subunit C [Magnetofaba australis IT-1]
MGIAAKVLRAFHGGVHPEEHKDLSQFCSIESAGIPDKLYVPLHQHIGAPCDPAVDPGETVKKGQRIGNPVGFISAAVHAPTSGVIEEIVDHPVGHPSGLTMLCAVLKPDGKDEWIDGLKGIADPFTAEPSAIRDAVREAGIVGLGGATFPSFVKLSPPGGKVAQILILNGVECEPYLTCDARLMEEQSKQIVDGAAIMLHALQTKECVIGIEDNKPAAIAAMQRACADHPQITVQALPVMYPQGSEKQLIEVITGKQVPSGGLPIDAGVICHNVATALAISEAVREGKPLISRVVTMTGLGITRPANFDTLMGTPVRHLIDLCGGMKGNTTRMVMGGPMMGVALRDMTALDVPVVKGTSGILCLTAKEATEKPEQPCIRCGHCLEVCPISLMPSEMAWLAKSDEFDKLQEYDIFDCIECGSCSYTCPANIPLVHYFRYGKLSIQAKERNARKTELAKARTQAKEERMAKEKAEREAKKKALKAKTAANKPAAAAEAKADASAGGDDKAAKAAKAAAAAKAAREAKAAAAGGDAAAPADDKAAKAAKAAAAAKAAKAAREAKLAKEAGAAETSDETPTAAPADDKAAKAAKAAAAAKAAKAAREAKLAREAAAKEDEQA